MTLPRATHARSARPATVTLSRSAALSISAHPPFPRPPAPWGTIGPSAEQSGTPLPHRPTRRCSSGRLNFSAYSPESQRRRRCRSVCLQATARGDLFQYRSAGTRAP
jgi:hypothetical protein